MECPPLSKSPFAAIAIAGTGIVRHELSFLNIFRLIQAVVYAGLAFSTVVGQSLQIGAPDFARGLAIARGMP